MSEHEHERETDQEQGSETATAPYRTVEYLEPELAAELPPALARSWPADETLLPLAACLEELQPDDARRLAEDAALLADDALLVLRDDALPPGDVAAHIYVDPDGGLEIVGTGPQGKVRVSADLSIVLIRRRPLPSTGPRSAEIRQELRQLLAIPLGGADRKPIAARRMTEHDELDRDGIFAEFDPPADAGFVNGRFGGMYAYTNRKVLAISFEPMVWAGDDAESDFDEEPEEESGTL